MAVAAMFLLAGVAQAVHDDGMWLGAGIRGFAEDYHCCVNFYIADFDESPTGDCIAYQCDPAEGAACSPDSFMRDKKDFLLKGCLSVEGSDEKFRCTDVSDPIEDSGTWHVDTNMRACKDFGKKLLRGW